ncbi:MAG: hypothetical protein RLZZ312_159 [Bacteroidota bacterium]|jgi:predicted transposase/invertase (TIGR01784 family)
MSKKVSKSTSDKADEVKKLHHIFDKLFKLVFGHKPSVCLYLKEFGDAEITNQLNFNSLQLDSTTYISKKMEAYFSDMVWQAEWGKERVAVSFLFEHKSKPERYVAVQVLTYICSILEKDVTEKHPLTLVLPSIVFHGKRHWKPKTLIQLYEKKAAPLHRFVPNFELPSFHVDAITDSQMLDLPDDTVLKFLFLLLKHGKDKVAVKKHFHHFFSFYEENPHLHRFLEPFVRSFSEITALEPEIVIELIENSLAPKTKKEIMTTYAQFVQKGKIEGKIEGILQNKIEVLGMAWHNKLPIALMIDLTNLPKTTVQLWISRFETLQKCHLVQKTLAETAKEVQLTEQQVTDWWAFFEKAAQPKKD